MKVLFIGATTRMGGGQQQLLHLIEGLQIRDVDVALIIPDDGPMYEKFQAIDIPIFPVPIRKISLISLLRVIAIIRKTKVDIIHTNGIGAGVYGRFAGKLLGRKVVHTYHGLNIKFYSPIKKLLYLLTEKFLNFFTDRAIAVSKGEMEYLLSEKIVSAGKITEISNGVPIPEQISSSEKNNNGNEKLIIGSLSRIDYQKGLDLLLESVPLLKKEIAQFKIQIIGGVPVGKERYYRKLLSILDSNPEIKQHVEFLGEVVDVDRYLDNFDLLVSTARWEGCPLSLLESGAKQKLIVASDVIGNNEIIIDEKTGFIIPDLTPASIAATIVQALNCKEKNKISKACLQHIKENFNVDKMILKTLQIYQSLLQ